MIKILKLFHVKHINAHWFAYLLMQGQGPGLYLVFLQELLSRLIQIASVINRLWCAVLILKTEQRFIGMYDARVVWIFNFSPKHINLSCPHLCQCHWFPETHLSRVFSTKNCHFHIHVSLICKCWVKLCKCDNTYIWQSGFGRNPCDSGWRASQLVG